MTEEKIEMARDLQRKIYKIQSQLAMRINLDLTSDQEVELYVLPAYIPPELWNKYRENLEAGLKDTKKEFDEL